MREYEEILRRIPQINVLLSADEGEKLQERFGRAGALRSLRSAVDELRAAILRGDAPDIDIKTLFERAAFFAETEKKTGMCPLINATGTILHTNLGRSPMAKEAVLAAQNAAAGYSALEFSLEDGGRGQRCSHAEALLRELTGAESALIVNNNASAVLLTLLSIARGRDVIVSRGELVEIGGSFRVPDIMEQSGCRLKEVGATNKTHEADYIRAVDDKTGALLKAHTSNYRIVGFTGEVGLERLAEIGREHGLPVIFDLGSGALLPLKEYGILDEPCVSDGIRAGADVICFSGDKLLGGPQAGIIIGKEKYLSKMRSHPLMRAIRPDKMTLAALEATLRLYRDPELAREKIPLFKMLSLPLETLKARAEALAKALSPVPELYLRVVQSEARLGGGSTPNVSFPSAALALRLAGVSAQSFYLSLLHGQIPVVGYIHKDELMLDMRTVEEASLETLAAAVNAAARALLRE